MKALGRPRILVTGGAGFIGSHTSVELWEAGYEPIILDNFSNSKPWMIGRIRQLTCPSVGCYDVDCTNYEAVAEVVKLEGNIFGIIHFAALKSVSESMKKPVRYMRNNLDSLKVMLAIKEDFNIPDFVFSSSATVYGSPESLPVDETTERQQAESIYGLTKQLGEDIILKRLETGGAILRYFNPIGAHASGLIGELPSGIPQNLVPYITQTAAGVREKLSVFGTDYPTEDGTAVRDYIHVVDLAKAHVAALMRLSGVRKTDIFNVGTGRGTSVQELIKAFEGVTGETLPVHYTKRREGDIAAIYADCSKANELLKWEAELTAADALRDAWNWQIQYKQMKKAA